jgi:hypothetical protein
MAGLDDVLERLVADPSFRQRLAANPSAALAGYDLSAEDRALLASQVTEVAGTGGKVEARTSRASMVGLLGALGELADASAELTTGEPDTSPAAGDDSGTWIDLDSYNVGVNQAGDGVGHDVLFGGAGADDPIPTAPSGSGYNELSLQDTSGRETPEVEPRFVTSFEAGDPDATTGEDDAIADLAARPEPGPGGVEYYIFHPLMDGEDQPAELSSAEDGGTIIGGDAADDLEAVADRQEVGFLPPVVQVAGQGHMSSDAPTGLTDGADAEEFLPHPFTDAMVSGIQLSGDAPTGGDDAVVDILEATGEGEPATGPLTSVEAVADADRAEAPPDGADPLQWDPGDGSDVAAKGEQIEIESWSPGTPPSSAEPVMMTSYSISTGGDEPAEPIAPTEHVSLVFGAIEFDHDAPAIGDLLEPDAGDPEPTGPIADVLYSAGGSTTGGVSGDPGDAGTGFYVSHDSGATWVEGVEPRGHAEAAFEAASSDASGDRHPAEMSEGSLAASPEEGTSPEGGLSLNFERMRVNYDPDQVGGRPTQAPDALGPAADDGESAAHHSYYDLLVSSFQSSGSADGEPARDGIADLVVGAGSHTDGADTAIVDQAEPGGAEPAGAGPNADVHAPTTADPSMATFAEYSVNLASPWNEWHEDFNVKGAEPEVEVVPPSDSPGWGYPILILPQMDQSGGVGGATDAPDDLGETRMTDAGGAGDSAAPGGRDAEPVDTGGTEAELYEYPGEYAQRFDGVDVSAPGEGLDVLIADQTGHESDDTVPGDQAIAIGGEADRAVGQGGGIINESGTMTLAGSTLPQSDDAVLEDQMIALGGKPTQAPDAIGSVDIAEAPRDGVDALAWDPGDGSDVATKGGLEIEMDVEVGK